MDNVDENVLNDALVKQALPGGVIGLIALLGYFAVCGILLG